MNTVYKAASVVALSFSLALPGVSLAAENLMPPPPPAAPKVPKGCKSKEAALQWKVAVAKENKDASQLPGLESALRDLKAWCYTNDAGARSRFDLWEKRREVREREQELVNARAVGKPEKIAKREQMLEKARNELQAVEAAVMR